MPIDPAAVATAQRLQRNAAQDDSGAVRLVAGPGTGKSSSIEERFRWLYVDEGVAPESVYGVSFTRAAANDLRLRVANYLDAAGYAVEPARIQVSTLHSLALRLLSRANLLGTYPVRPRVFDEWEVEHVFDAELRLALGTSKQRSVDVRRAHEAFWNTGERVPPGYIAPEPPISDEERTTFLGFHRVTTATYAAVLPGEIVRRSVEEIEAGLLVLREVADMSFMIVDEYQDLNPLDIRLIDKMAEDGVSIFAAGDDDQSIYSFRFAAPGGIQDVTSRHPGAGDHILEGCFRCATQIVNAADSLIDRFSPATRIPKDLESLWATATPPIEGIVHRWRVPDGDREAVMIADSVRDLINADVRPDKIMILLSNKRLFPRLRAELDSRAIPYVPPKEDTWSDSEPGRFMYGMLRVVLGEDDYLALRAILGCRLGVGVGTCAQIVGKASARLLNYRDLFYQPLPDGVFDWRETSALEHAREVCAVLSTISPDGTVGPHGARLRELLVQARSEAEASAWDEVLRIVPRDSTLAEVRDYLASETPDQQERVLTTVFERLDQPLPDGIPQPRVRVMTMHGAKGLQADVVFVPGLEEQILPGPRRASTGLVLEGARLMYVSMTRARAAVVVSLARARYWLGRRINPAPSPYAAHLGGAFVTRVSRDEVYHIKVLIDSMNDT